MSNSPTVPFGDFPDGPDDVEALVAHTAPQRLDCERCRRTGAEAYAHAVFYHRRGLFADDALGFLLVRHVDVLQLA